MNIKLDRPLIFYDLETTGLNVVTDRIVSIAVIKLMPNGEREQKNYLINPTIPIPKVASDIHGITDEMVKEQPPFWKLAKNMFRFFEGCDIAGFNNNHYDNQLLAEEFARCGLLFPSLGTRSVDVGVMFEKLERRTLIASAKFYLNLDFADEAHDSMKDTIVTLDVFNAMLERYDELIGSDVDFLDTYSKKIKNQVGYSLDFVYNEENEVCYNKGRVRGIPIHKDLSFGAWMMRKEDMPASVKMTLQHAMLKQANLIWDLETNEPNKKGLKGYWKHNK